MHDPTLWDYCPILQQMIILILVLQSSSSSWWSPEGGLSCIHHRERHQGRQGEVSASQGTDQSVCSISFQSSLRYNDPLQIDDYHEEDDDNTGIMFVPFDIWYLTCSSSESSSTGNSEHWSKETICKEWPDEKLKRNMSNKKINQTKKSENNNNKKLN